ncbi:hypothetical protein fHeYen902_106c [Yersinia phage fHe-Yen9-02]|nr:hypothetical protein fHeYen902_106c [Yersinia phage fHe-Yen9-02]
MGRSESRRGTCERHARLKQTRLLATQSSFVRVSASRKRQPPLALYKREAGSMPPSSRCAAIWAYSNDC